MSFIPAGPGVQRDRTKVIVALQRVIIRAGGDKSFCLIGSSWSHARSSAFKGTLPPKGEDALV